MEKNWKLFPKISDELYKQLLANRNLKNDSEIEKFIHPHLSKLENSFELFPSLKKAVDRISTAVKKGELIYVYGDYDVDGITGTAILWETIEYLGGKVMPYIPSRHSEGYGLHKEALKSLAEEGAEVVISVDCGITAITEAQLAKKLGIDLIITDHHQPLEELPKPFALVHTTKLAGSGVAFRLAEALLDRFEKSDTDQYFKNLELAALGTISDMVPLRDDNRVIVKNGLLSLAKTKRIGLRALYEEAALGNTIGVYEVGFVIAPRLNAMGRLDSAMDSLRLLLTRNKQRGDSLAKVLSLKNKERQQKTLEVYEDAKKKVEQNFKNSKFLVISSSSYPEGVVGLAASKLVENFYRPVAVIGQGEKVFKGSARSVNGFNVIEAIHTQAKLLRSHGGHPMAAGFSIEEQKIPIFRDNLEKFSAKVLSEELLTPVIKIDAELLLSEINPDLETLLKIFEPFGVGNQEPTFLTRELQVEEARDIGTDNKHIKLKLNDKKGFSIMAVGFGLNGKKPSKGTLVDIVYNLRVNNWNGRKTLELRLKDVRMSV